MSEFKKIYAGNAYDSVISTPKLRPVSRVTVIVSDDVSYTAGDDSGEILTVHSPWGSQRVADNLLAEYRGYEYQPYEGENGYLDPAAEIGDGVSAGGVYGGLFSQIIDFDYVPRSDFGAPYTPQQEHEFPAQSPKDRETHRQRKYVSSTLKVHAGLISAEVEARKTSGEELSSRLTVTENGIVEEATARLDADKDLSGRIDVQAGLIDLKVSQSGGTEDGSFSYEMTPQHAKWFSNGTQVVCFEKDNFSFEGTLRAKAGTIGGFTIEEGCLSTEGATFDDCPANGIYWGPRGINMGGQFVVDSGGNLFAVSGTFKGTIYAGSIESGGDAGTFDGGGISTGTVLGGQWGQLASNTVSVGNVKFGSTLGQVSTNTDDISSINDKLTGVTSATNIHAQILRGDAFSVPPEGSFSFMGYYVKWALIDPNTWALVRSY